MTKTLLIVDDEISIRDLYSQVAERSGYNPLTAENGEQAVEQASSADFILMDCDMPIMDGLEALAAIRAQDKIKPIIMMTGLPSEEREAEFQRLGADYLAKPFNLKDLLEKLEQYQ